MAMATTGFFGGGGAPSTSGALSIELIIAIAVGGVVLLLALLLLVVCVARRRRRRHATLDTHDGANTIALTSGGIDEQSPRTTPGYTTVAQRKASTYEQPESALPVYDRVEDDATPSQYQAVNNFGRVVYDRGFPSAAD